MRTLDRALLGVAMLGLLASLLEETVSFLYPKYRPLEEMFFFLARFDLIDGLILCGSALICWWLVRHRKILWFEPAWNRLICKSHVALIAFAVLIITYAGTKVVYHEYALSMDEYAAEYQAQIFASGHLALPLEEKWRRDSPRLAPIFIAQTPYHTEWKGSYLPVYAACRALFECVRQPWLTNPVMGALSILLMGLVARQLWPDEEQAPFAAALLLATSTQFLITSMSAYSMSGHLLFNLLWIYLFLSKESWKFLLTPWIGGLSMGLHQMPPHLLFAFPFFIGLLWRKHLLTLTYFSAVYLLFLWIWSSYFSASHQVPALAYLQYFGWMSPTMYARCLIVGLQLFTWQSIAASVFFYAGVVYIRNGSPVLFQIFAGIALTFIFYSFYDLGAGHGWGARYLFPVMGNWPLVATFGYLQLLRHCEALASPRLLLWSTLAMLIFQFPARCIETDTTIRPYYNADLKIKAQDADFVILNGKTGWYLNDLVRNGPDLDTQRPLVYRGDFMKQSQVEALKKRGKTVIMSQKDFAELGILYFDYDHQ